MIGSRWTFRILIISLMLNAFLAGLVVARLDRPDRPGPPPEVDPMGMVGRVASTLPESDARILREAFQREREVLEAAAAALRDGPALLGQTLRAEPYDPEATRRAMRELGARREVLIEGTGRAFSAAAARMSAEGRRRLAEFPPPPRRP